MQARYVPIDLAAATAELASVFRSAIEGPGRPSRWTVRRWTNRSTWTATCGRRCSQPAVERVEVHVRRLHLRRCDGTATRGGHRRGHRDRCARRRDASAVRAIPPHRDRPGALQRGQRHRAGPGEGVGRSARRRITAESAEGAGTTFTVRLPFGSRICPPKTWPRATGARVWERAIRTCRRRCGGCRRTGTSPPIRRWVSSAWSTRPRSRVRRPACWSPTTTPTCATT